MTAQTYANFPERDLKVVLGPNINATATKLLRKMSLGMHEMTVAQQEKLSNSRNNGRHGMNALARELQLTVTGEDDRDYLAVYKAESSAHRLQIWITAPFEGSQTTHLVWAKYTDLTQPRRIGVTFKLATSYNSTDIQNILRAAMKSAVDLEPDQPFTLKGNPPPRFTKKVKPADEAKTEEAKADGAAPASTEETPPAE